MTYTVRVTREETNWLGDVEGLAGAHSYARSLRTLDERMREVVALVEDLPEGAEPGLELAWDYSQVAPEAVAAAHLAQERAQVERARERIASDTRHLIAGLLAEGWSSRDIAAVLGLSPGRVSQLTGEPRTHAA
jgi:DNA-directed RNA polymerase specialized sigma24 family protein